MNVFLSSHPVPGASLDALWRRGESSFLERRFGGRPDLESLVARSRALAAKGAPRDEVVARLVTANEELGHRAGARAAERLAEPGAVAILAGQQPAPFGGPLMVFLKAWAAVALSVRLEERAGRPVVPIFWNHTEDHDLEEINRFHLLGPMETARERLPLADEGRTLEAVRLDAACRATASGWLRRLGSDAPPEDLLPRPDEPIGSWSARCLLRGLGRSGLVLLEPHVLRDLNAPWLDEWIGNADRWHERFLESAEEVARAGFARTIESSGGGHLFSIGRGGARVPLRRREGSWIRGTDPVPLCTRQLREELARNPAAFSTNVVTRPLAQQWLLPVVAQITGPAETAYLAEIAPLLEAFGLDAPLPWPRPRALHLDAAAARRRRKLGLRTEDLLHEPESWPAGRVAPGPEVAEFEPARAEFLARLSEDAGLEGAEALEAFDRRLGRGLDWLARRLRRERARAEEGEANARHRLANRVWPRHRPQERLASPWQLFGVRGEAEIQAALETLDPADHRQHVWQAR